MIPKREHARNSEQTYGTAKAVPFQSADGREELMAIIVEKGN
jgi:hypothetical protein